MILVRWLKLVAAIKRNNNIKMKSETYCYNFMTSYLISCTVEFLKDDLQNVGRNNIKVFCS